MKAPKTTHPATVNALMPEASSHFSPRSFHTSHDQQNEEKKENKTGLPDQLKTGIENLSGISLDDVKVHYNSDKPSELGALAYTQGTNIHVGPAQERHLPHETWHVVQQKQGRVAGERQLKGYSLNDNAILEHEADVMGSKSLQRKRDDIRTNKESKSVKTPVQRMTRRKGSPLTRAERAQAIAIGENNYRSKSGHGRADHGKRASSTPQKVKDRQAASSRQKAIDEVIQLKSDAQIRYEKRKAAREREEGERLSALPVGRRAPEVIHIDMGGVGHHLPPVLHIDQFGVGHNNPANELQQGRMNLKRADFGVVNPNLQHIRTRRGPHQSPEDYFDHLLDVRRSITELMSQPVGARMLTELNARQAQVNPPTVGQNPSTIVDIYSGRGLNNDSAMSHGPRHNNTYTDVRRGYRFNGVPGPGQASRVTFNENALSANREISLGHEMVHAWRTAHGVGVAPPQISHQRDAPVLNTPGDENRLIERAVALHAQEQEEFETVGLLNTPHTAWAPSENMIRAEQGRPVRGNYSGAVPGHLDETINNLDEATDDRNWFEKHILRSPHPHHVRTLLHHLED